MSRWLLVACALAVTVLCLLANLAFVGLLEFERSTATAHEPCLLPTGPESTYGHPEWQWFPPGTACVSDDGVVFDEPGARRAGIAVGLPLALIASTVATVWLWYVAVRARRQSTPPPPSG